jgi:hypothetical protein
VTGKKRSRRGSYRPPPKADAPEVPPRRGLLDSLFAPRAAFSTSMPGMGRSLARGLVTVLASQWIVGLGSALVLVIWLVAVLAGFKGPFSLLVNALSIPPVSTWSTDGVPATLAAGGLGAIGAALGTIVVRAAIHAAFTGLIVDQLEGGAASHWSLVRGLRAFPTTLAVALAGFMLLTLGFALAPILGGISLLVLLAALVLGVYLFAFAPVVALTQNLRALAALSTSMRAARMPGSSNLLFAVGYALSSIVLLFIPKPGSLLGVNPSFGAWLVVLATSLAHLAFQAAFAYRYLAIADEVPEAPERRQPTGKRR